jgi:hypothetical protein
VLRRASFAEQIRDGGTAVRIWITRDPSKSHGGKAVKFFSPRDRASDEVLFTESPGIFQMVALPTLVRLLCPTLDVNVRVKNGDEDILVIRPEEWLSTEGPVFFGRVEAVPDSTRAVLLAENLRDSA